MKFNSKKTAGKTITTVEMLKNKSILTSDTPTDEVNKYLNIWVGNSGFATQNNIKNAVVCFKVEKSWIQNKSIDQSSITLNKYYDKTWNQLPTKLTGEDDKCLYFIAQTPGFSPFAITGEITATGTTQPATGKTQTANVNEAQTEMDTKNTTANTEQTSKQTQSSNTSGKDSTKTPGFKAFFGIVSLLAIFLHKRK